MHYGMELQHIGAYSRVVSRGRMIPDVCSELQNVSISTESGESIRPLGVSGSPEDAKVGAYTGVTTGLLSQKFISATMAEVLLDHAAPVTADDTSNDVRFLKTRCKRV